MPFTIFYCMNITKEKSQEEICQEIDQLIAKYYKTKFGECAIGTLVGAGVIIFVIAFCLIGAGIQEPNSNKIYFGLLTGLLSLTMFGISIAIYCKISKEPQMVLLSKIARLAEYVENPSIRHGYKMFTSYPDSKEFKSRI